MPKAATKKTAKKSAAKKPAKKSARKVVAKKASRKGAVKKASAKKAPPEGRREEVRGQRGGEEIGRQEVRRQARAGKTQESDANADPGIVRHVARRVVGLRVSTYRLIRRGCRRFGLA